MESLAAQIERATALVDEDALVRTVGELVRIPSVNHPDALDVERPVADYLCSLFDRWEMPYTRWGVEPGRPNVVVDIQGSSSGPTVLFEGHMDVVTAGNPGHWSFDPFGGQVYEGRICGRGAADMKGGLAAMIFATRAIQLADTPFPGRIRLAILCDEEGMMIGAKDFVNRGYLEGVDAVISCEPEGGRVCVAQKGAIRLQVDIKGRMAHGCMPREGANPIAAMGEIIRACGELEREVASIAGEHPLLGEFYCTPTVASAGEPQQANVVPNQARLYVDVRTTPQVDHDEVITTASKRFQECADRVPGVSVEVPVLDDRPSTETSPDEAIVQSLLQEHERVFGSVPALGGVPGSTDATIFWAATGVPVAVYGPGDTTIPHQVDEFVRVDEVLRCAQVYVGAALRYLHREGPTE